jgi:hypothetical protein
MLGLRAYRDSLKPIENIPALRSFDVKLIRALLLAEIAQHKDSCHEIVGIALDLRLCGGNLDGTRALFVSYGILIPRPQSTENNNGEKSDA